MDIRVSGHQVDTGEALRSHVEERVTALAEKYFSRTISAQVTFGQGPHANFFTCEIIAYVPQGVVLKGTAQAADAHACFNQASERIEKQLRRYSRRLKDHSIEAAHAEQVANAIDAGYTVFQAGSEEEEAEDNPLIVAETRVDIPDASVSDAVMLLDLRNTNALMFRNRGTSQFNMVYRRDDGTIGWVEPQRD